MFLLIFIIIIVIHFNITFTINMMNLEKFFIIENKNGKKTQEKYLKKKFPELYQKIIDFNKNNLHNISFKEKIWHYIYNIDTKILCKNCKKELKFKRSLSEGYGIYCSNKCANKCPDHIEKTKKTNIEKYGGQGTSSDIIKNKIKKTTLKNYGVDNIFKRTDIIKDSFLKKYGVDNVSKVNGVKEKIKKTNLEKYGLISNLLNVDTIKKSLKTKKEKFINRYIDLKIINPNGKIVKIECEKCHNVYEIDRSVLLHRKNYNVEICTICNPVSISISFSEKEILNYIKEILPDEKIENKNRKIIYPQEIDVYLPNKKIGIEYNGLFWHSSYKIDKNYHLMKYLKSKKNGIKLLQIFEDEWLNKKEIVKSIIKTNFNLFDETIYGRKCFVKEINNEICKNFVDNNHIQGHHNSKIKLGLFYGNKLVSVMTFGSLRKSLGMKKIENVYEMIRFCNLKNTKIIGAASKLFKYFLKNYSPDKVISFSDNRYFTGNLYETLGFKFISDTKPNYYYIKDRKRINRFNYRKDVLVSMGYDINKSEKEITEEIGLYRIYDCGNKKWEYNNIK